jgi:predicted phage baseplate assembly protein
MSESCHDRDIAGPCDAPDLDAKRPDNRPALNAVSYRIGKHRDFVARMLHALPREAVEDRGTGIKTQPLKALTTRTTDDPTIALIDAFATSLDVLTFYQERIANEGYIRTATERMSALELMRTIDYELKPGVAASASLAFTVEDADDPFRVVEVPTGTQVLSIPSDPKVSPQTFETVETIQARAEWNAIPARTERPQNIAMYWNVANESDARNGDLYLLDLDNGFDFSEADSADIVTIDTATAGNYLPVTPGLSLTDALADLSADAAVNPEINATIKGIHVDHILIKGLGLSITQGGRMLVVGVLSGVATAAGTTNKVRVKALRIDAVEEDSSYALTKVQLGKIEVAPAAPRALNLKFSVPLLRLGTPQIQTIAFNASSASSVIGRASWSSSTLSAFVQTQDWSRTQVMSFFRETPEVSAPSVGDANPGFYFLRQSVPFFGAAAPKHAAMAKADQTRGGTGAANDPYHLNWDKAGPQLAGVAGPATVWSDSQGKPLTDAQVYLEREVPEIVPDSWVLLEKTDGTTRAFRVARVATESRADFALSGKTSGLTLRDPDGTALNVWGVNNALNAGFGTYTFRTTTAKVASEALTLGGLPIKEAVAEGDTDVMLNGLYLDLVPGLSVSIAGEREDAPGINEDETCTLEDVVHVGGYTRLTFTEGVSYGYTRTSVRVNANVALATHGETKAEILGSGDATKPNQAFKLTKPPLTFVSAATDTGAATTLSIRVDNILWSEVESLYDVGASDEVYIVRIDDDGTTRVVFGDGIHGKRLPTGSLNITASYRSGMGYQGDVEEETLTLLKTRPLGVRAVTNPSAAKGSADAETLEDARERGPQSVRTLGRIVSLTDYEDFARAFAGIGKAKATALWRGRKRLVHVSIAPASEGVFDADDTTIKSLTAAMEGRRDPAQDLIVAPHSARYFKMAARVAYDTRYLADDVEASVRNALTTTFGYEARQLADPVSAAAVIACIQNVSGVAYVDLDGLAIYSDADPDAVPSLETLLPAMPARLAGTGDPPDVEPAELLVIFADGIDLTMEASDA